MEINLQQRQRLEFLKEEMRKVAEPIGPLHSWWEVIFDIEDILNNKEPFVTGKDAEWWIMEARSCFLHAKMEIPYEGIK